MSTPACRRRVRGSVAAAAAIVLLAAAAGESKATSGETARPAVSGVRAPAVPQAGIVFEENLGQVAPEAQFVVRTRRGTAFVTPAGVVLPLDAASVSFVGAADAVRGEGRAPTGGVSNYLRGADRSADVKHARHFGHVVSANLYPGVDLCWRGTASGELEYELTIAPGGDPARIAFEVDGAASRTIDEAGDLVARTAHGTVRQSRPVLRQTTEHGRVTIDCAFELRGPREVGFRVGAYDASLPLVLDPVVSWSTYLGGTASEDSETLTALGRDGLVYVAGTTDSVVFPVKDLSRQRAIGGLTDIFVSMYQPDGRKVDFAIYYGGAAEDRLGAFFIDKIGNIYIGGRTRSPDWPAMPSNVPQPAPGGGYDACYAKIAPAGDDLQLSLRWGGSGDEDVCAMAAAADHTVLIAGDTNSTDFPLVAPLQPAYGGGASDAFAVKVNGPATAVLFSTCLGGDGADAALAAVREVDGTYVLAGRTASAKFPVTSSPAALQAAFGGGADDAFVARLAADGSALLYSTFLGGSASDEATGVAADGAGTILVSGRTRSAGFPVTPGAVQRTKGADDDAFVARIEPSGALGAATFLGGGRDDRANAVGIDSTGAAYVCGTTNSPDFPLVAPVRASLGGTADAFVAKLDPALRTLVYSTYFGGSGADTGTSVSVSPLGLAVVAGTTTSDDFPLVTPYQARRAGPDDVFLATFAPTGRAPVPPTGVFARRRSQTEVDLTWTDASDDETGFRIERRSGSGVFAVIATVGANTTHFEDATIPAPGPYAYRVAGVGAGGVSVSGEAPVKIPARWLTFALAPSSILDAKKEGADQIRVGGRFTVEGEPYASPMNPQAGGVSFAIAGRGPLAALEIQSGDAAWKASRSGVWSWKSPRGAAPQWDLRIDTRHRTFRIRAKLLTLALARSPKVTVSLVADAAPGADTRDWDVPGKLPRGVAALIRLAPRRMR